MGACEKRLSAVGNGKDDRQNEEECDWDPDGRQHPEPRPADTAGQFQRNEQDRQKAAEADAVGAGVVVFHVVSPENGQQKTTVQVQRGSVNKFDFSSRTGVQGPPTGITAVISGFAFFIGFDRKTTIEDIYNDSCYTTGFDSHVVI